MPQRRLVTGAGSLVVLTWMLTAACSSSSSSGSGGAGDGAAASSGTQDGGPGASGATGAGGAGATGTGGLGGQTLSGVDANVVQNLCSGDGCTCSNGKDDDGDGLIDGFDPECTGPLDNDEGSFATGIPGDNIDPKWQDCFFDGNSGGGDDHCRYSTKCLTGELPQTDPDCVTSQQCLDYCKRLVPNGCDCFGCCTIGSGATAVDVIIQGTCSLDKIGDEKACPRCEKATTCQNQCGECELCPGKTEADLPDSCRPKYDGGTPPTGDASTPPPPVYTCDEGRAPCSATTPCANPTSYYCQLGCCMPIVR